MNAKKDFTCDICGTISFKGEEYGYIYHVKTYKACILCVRAAEDIEGIEITV